MTVKRSAMVLLMGGSTGEVLGQSSEQSRGCTGEAGACHMKANCGRLAGMWRWNRCIAVMVVLVVASLCSAQGVQINRAEPQIERHRFDPKNPPANMPALEKDEAAVTKSIFGIESAFAVEVMGD